MAARWRAAAAPEAHPRPQNPWKKYLGACNDFKERLSVCLTEEVGWAAGGLGAGAGGVDPGPGRGPSTC